MNRKILFSFFCATTMITACTEQPGKREEAADFEKGTLGYDARFLREHDSTLIELKDGEARVLVSPKYQAKVFTSSAAGDSGSSFGWINYKAFTAAIDPHMNAYGGENRFWLGPEGGKYSLYFKKGDSMVFDNWKTPAAIDTESWNVKSSGEKSVTLQKAISLENYTGARLDMTVDREISILAKTDIEKALGVTIGDQLQYVGYATANRLTNTGKEKWSDKTGMPVIWILDMFNPSPKTTIVVPYKESSAKEKVATTDYFGEIAADRIKLSGKTLFFRADGKSRGKLGITPAKVLPFAGSYNADDNVLTVTRFTVDNKAKYLNQEWNPSKPAFTGDAMNAYNDGPLADGSQMGPFYEIESVSPAVPLAAGESVDHQHDVFHFTGSKEELNKISLKTLGVSLEEIQNAF